MYFAYNNQFDFNTLRVAVPALDIQDLLQLDHDPHHGPAQDGESN